MPIVFPVVTSPRSRRFDFLNEFQTILNSQFKELIVVSPFVDAYIIENVVKRCIFKDRKMIVITRYQSQNDNTRQLIDEAIERLVKYEKKDRDLPDKVVWYCNERVHAKFIIMDWDKILFGSQNLTEFGGLQGNYELGAVISEKDKVIEVRSFFDDVVKSSKKKPLYPIASTS